MPEGKVISLVAKKGKSHERKKMREDRVTSGLFSVKRSEGEEDSRSEST